MFKFIGPCTMTVSGQTGAGKTSSVMQLLKDLKKTYLLKNQLKSCISMEFTKKLMMKCKRKCYSLKFIQVYLMNQKLKVLLLTVTKCSVGIGNAVFEAYMDAHSEPYSYLVINISPHGDNEFKIISKIFPEEDNIVYRV